MTKNTKPTIQEVLDELWNKAMQSQSGSEWNKKEIQKSSKGLAAILKDAMPDVQPYEKLEECSYCCSFQYNCSCSFAIEQYENQLIANLKERGISI